MVMTPITSAAESSAHWEAWRRSRRFSPSSRPDRRVTWRPSRESRDRWSPMGYVRARRPSVGPAGGRRSSIGRDFGRTSRHRGRRGQADYRWVLRRRAAAAPGEPCQARCDRRSTPRPRESRRTRGLRSGRHRASDLAVSCAGVRVGQESAGRTSRPRSRGFGPLGFVPDEGEPTARRSARRRHSTCQAAVGVSLFRRHTKNRAPATGSNGSVCGSWVGIRRAVDIGLMSQRALLWLSKSRR
jgi:hypothetical protein